MYAKIYVRDSLWVKGNYIPVTLMGSHGNIFIIRNYLLQDVARRCYFTAAGNPWSLIR